MKIVAIDPGGTTGWCLLVDGVPTTYGEVKAEVFQDWANRILPTMRPDVIVCENFITRPDVRKGKWFTNEVPKQIGVLSAVAYHIGCKFVEQEPSIKPVGYGMAHLKYVKGKKGTHVKDAIAHGVFYWMKEGRIERLRKSRPSN